MKKIIKDIKTLAALLIAGAAFTACSSSSDDIIEQPVKPTEPKVYTMVIKASKGGDATTRALSLSGSTLTASWATTENVYVKKGSDWATGSFQPETSGTTATLKGSLSGITIAADDNLTLQFPKSGDITYAGQLGTLADIQTNFDWTTANVEVESVSPSGNINPKAATTTFTNQQAIIKFTLQDKGNSDAAISPSAFTVSDGTSTVELTNIPADTYTANGASNVLYVAFPAAGSAKTITLTATVGDNVYNYSKSGATFVNGQYYEITVKMNKILSRVTESNATGVLAGGYKAITADQAATLAKQCWTVAGGTVYVVYNIAGSPILSVYYVKTDDGESTTSSYIPAKSASTLYAEGSTAWFVEPTYTMASAATTADKGKLICTAGHIHAYGSADGCSATRVAKIIYVGSDMCEDAPYNHGLALAMSDANSGSKCYWRATMPEGTDPEHDYHTLKNTFTTESGLQYNESHNNATYPAFQAAISNNSTTKPTGCSDWFLPTAYQFNQMISAAGSLNNLINGFSSVGGTNMQSSSSSFYWVATEANRPNAWLYKTGTGNPVPSMSVDTTPGWYDKGKLKNCFVRSTIAF